MQIYGTRLGVQLIRASIPPTKEIAEKSEINFMGILRNQNFTLISCKHTLLYIQKMFYIKLQFFRLFIITLN